MSTHPHLKALYHLYLRAFIDGVQGQPARPQAMDTGETWSAALGLSVGLHARAAASTSDAAFMPHDFNAFAAHYSDAMKGILP